MISRQVLDSVLERSGFERWGVCSAKEPFASQAFYSEWIGDGRHAGMSYLAAQIELKRSLENLLPGVQSCIMVAKSYAQPNEPVTNARIARYARGKDYHRVMRSDLARIARELAPYAAEEKFRACVDSAPVFERELANRAGLGWFGKNSCLIDSKTGSYFLIGALLTTALLEPNAPAEGGCGTCQKCVQACPTGAISFWSDRWQVDSRECISFWTIESKDPIPERIQEHLNQWAFGCDICQEVCPFNEVRASQPARANPTADARFLPTTPNYQAEELLALGVEDWEEWSRGRAVRRAGYEGIKRNARAILEHE